jgi:ADP-ribose pyrophosphatase
MMKPEMLSRTTVYESPWVNLYLDTVKFPNGRVIEKYHLLDFPLAAVAMIVENEFGNVVCARICRYSTGLAEWELPAGGVEVGETEIEAAKREVLEETGYTTEDHQLIYSYYPMNGSANKLFHVVHCKAVEHVQEFDENEVSETHWFTRAEVRQMIRKREITDGFSLTALLQWLEAEFRIP